MNGSPNRLPASKPVNLLGEPIVFILREWAYINNKTDEISNSIRGEKGDQGPYPVSGGKPAGVIVCFDYHPKFVDLKMQSMYP